MKSAILFISCLICGGLFLGCQGESSRDARAARKKASQPQAPTAQPETGSPAPTFTLSSPAFKPGQPIPKLFCLDGQNLSPPLNWTAPPAGTLSFCLIAEAVETAASGSDAPEESWVHWVYPYIHAGERSLAKNAGSRLIAGGAVMGKNDFGRLGYDGPTSPEGEKNRRVIVTIYALGLDLQPQVKTGMTKTQLMRTIRGHVLTEAKLSATTAR